MEYKKKLIKVLTYTSIESIVYQAMLFVHQIMLFRTLPTQLYGEIGILFSGIFLGAYYANAGLDISLAPLFKRATQNKHMFKELILKQMLYTILLASGILTIALLICSSKLSYQYLFLCALLVITESYKKATKNILHLSFHQRVVAITEITTLFFYVATIWSSFLLGIQPSVLLIFVPMVCISLITISIYSRYVFRIYLALDNTPLPEKIYWPTIITMRFKNFAYQVSRSLYSGNFLVPLVASQYGLELAGLLKIISMSAYSINSIIQHIFGITSDVFFASMKGSTHKLKHSLFSKLSTYIYHLFFVICLALFLHHRYIHLLSPDVCSDHMHIIYLFLLVLFSENIALTHEHLFIVEEKTTLLIVSNLLLLMPLFITQYFNISCSLYSLLFGLLITRILSLITLSLFGWYAWDLRPKLGIKPLYLSVSAAIAFICFLLS